MGKTTNVECKVDWKTVLVFVSIAFSSQCGGGFASGSTPWTYFFRNTGFYGMLPVVAQPYFCLFMPFIVAAIKRTDGNSISVFYTYYRCSYVCSVYERHRSGPEECSVHECCYFHCADVSSCA